MAKLSANGTELYRYVCARAQGLLSVRSNGVVLVKRPFSGSWKVYARRKPGVSMEEWLEFRKKTERNLKFWQRVDRIPSFKTLERYSFDCVAESTAGNTVEPDGWDSEGNPSWLLVLGMV